MMYKRGDKVAVRVTREILHYVCAGGVGKVKSTGCWGQVVKFDDYTETYLRNDCLHPLREFKDGEPYRIHLPNYNYELKLPKGPLKIKIAYIERELFGPAVRIKVCGSTTYNRIYLEFQDWRLRKEHPNWGLTALNIGKTNGAVHTQKRRIQKAQPRAGKKATKTRTPRGATAVKR